MEELLQEILRLERENNALLKKVEGLLRLVLEDNDYSQSQDMRAFCINVAADIFVDMLTEDTKRNLKSTFRDKRH